MKKKQQENNSRLTLKSWAAMEDLRRSIGKLAEEGNWSAVPEFIFRIIELSKKIDRDLPWQDVVSEFSNLIEKNLPTKPFPILTSKEKSSPLPWEYEGRAWYFWLNLFASAYGWSEQEIAKMDIDDAVGLYQEITIDDQLKSEWEWGLSEISYEYNPSTKKSHFKALARPDWMRGIVGKPKPVKKTKIPVAMMPAGNVVVLDEEET